MAWERIVEVVAALLLGVFCYFIFTNLRDSLQTGEILLHGRSVKSSETRFGFWFVFVMGLLALLFFTYGIIATLFF